MPKWLMLCDTALPHGRVSLRLLGTGEGYEWASLAYIVRVALFDILLILVLAAGTLDGFEFVKNARQ
jgi:hypothetical protein